MLQCVAGRRDKFAFKSFLRCKRDRMNEKIELAVFIFYRIECRIDLSLIANVARHDKRVIECAGEVIDRFL